MIDLVPRKLVAVRAQEGWSAVPGYPPKPRDYAVLMQSPDHVDDRVPLPEIDEPSVPLLPTTMRSNKQRGAAYRNAMRGEARKFPCRKT